jgi:Na+/melibiose symporter-like transporter
VNLWTLVLGHVVNCSDRDQRSAVISGFAVQETLLRLLAKGIFPLWDEYVHRTVGVQDTLLRYRVHMGICTFFCFFGLVVLFTEHLQERRRRRNDLPAAAAAGGEGGAVASAMKEGTTPRMLPCATATTAVPVVAASVKPNRRFAMLLLALFLQSMATTMVMVLWPLYLRDRFAFGPQEYGGMNFAASMASTLCVAAFPPAERRFGRTTTACSLLAVAATSVVLAFVVASPGPGISFPQGGLATHVIFAVILHAALLTTEPSMKSLISMHASSTTQGRSLGLMATLSGLGGVGGNTVGTYLYANSKGPPSGQQSVASPFVFACALLGAAAVVVGVVGDKTTDAGPATAVFADDISGHERTTLLVEEGLSNPGGSEISAPIALNQLHPAPSALGLGVLLRETSCDLKMD